MKKIMQFICFLICVSALQSCFDNDAVKPTKDFFSKSQWSIVGMKYTDGKMNTSNGVFYGIGQEEIDYYNRGSIRIVDSSFLFGNTLDYMQYDGRTIVIKAYNDTINPNNENMEMVMVEGNNTERDDDWLTLYWKGSRQNRAGEKGVAETEMRDNEGVLTLFITLQGNPELIGSQFEIKLK